MSATAVSGWQAIRATRAEHLAQAERNRALDAEKLANEQTDRALKAEQIARAELERVASQVRRIKEATVYLKSKVAGKTLASGTGFVVDVTADSVLLATSRQVAAPDLARTPQHLSPANATPEIEAVFLSGQGPPHEQTLPAHLIAVDTSDDLCTDLAFLVVKGVKHSPTPINMLNRLDPTPGMAYLGAGFPPSSNLMEGNGNPSVAIIHGGIAALGHDQHGQLTSIQVDEGFTPADRGGPIVEERTGTLIGVGISKGSGTAGSISVAVTKPGTPDPIAFLIPADEVRRALAGRVGAVHVALESIHKGTADLQVDAQLVDPRNMVNAVMVHVAPVESGTIVPYSDGSWPPLRNTQAIELRPSPDNASASGRIHVALSEPGEGSRKVLVQTAHQYRSGQLVYSKPKAYHLPEKPGPVYPAGTPLQLILNTARRASLALLGPLVDPDKDCRLEKDDVSNTIKIEVPGDTLHTLAPQLVTAEDKTKPLHNAPTTLTAVEGDFAAIVEVTGELSPSLTLPDNRQGNAIPSTFQAAGLLLYQDKDNFVRLERTASVAVGWIQPVHRLLLEVVKNGKVVESEKYSVPPDRPSYLFLTRRTGRLIAASSPDLTVAPAPLKAIAIDLPAKLKIGLSASNISAAPFTATFENFALLSDPSIIEARFGNTPAK